MDAMADRVDALTTDAAPPDAGTADVPVAQDADRLGTCFEIFPEIDPASPEFRSGPAHGNPLMFDFGRVPVGASSLGSLRYYNFCGDSRSIVLGTELLGAMGGTPDPSFRIEAAPAPGTSLSAESFGLYVRVRFTPNSPGIRNAVVRYRVSHGYYETLFTATGFAP